MADHLPVSMRSHLHRLVGLLRSDLGDIERDYPAWIRQYDRVDADARRGIMAEIARITHPPMISTLMPVFNPAPDHLLAAIHSVRDQLYPWWELCICDDASTDKVVIDILEDFAGCDHRIKLVRHARNSHISAASNSALKMATGAFVALLDHDDVLPPHALHEVAARIVSQPNVDIIYSDEDHIDDEGLRSHPYFKPDWDAELILGQNLISHLGVYRRSLIEQIGGFRTGLEGSQDYDLALRMVAETRAERIAHIPKVLYHWRQGTADPSFSEAAHDRCVRNGRRAVFEFVARRHPGARVEPARHVPAWTHVVYPVPTPAPLVSVIVSGEGSADALSACINGLLNRTDYKALEILIVAGREGDKPGASGIPARSGTPAADPRVRRTTESRYQVSINEAAETARGSLLLMLDSNLIASDAGWLGEMVSHAVRPQVGAVGAKLLCPFGTVCHAGIAVGGEGVAFTPLLGQRHKRVGYFGHLQLVRNVTAVSTACLMVDRQKFLSVGGVDEMLSVPMFRSVDLCLKLAQGGDRIVWTPYAELSLCGDGGLFGGASHPEWEAARMRRRWGEKLEADRFWNPNLSADPSEVALAFPPRNTKSGSVAGPCRNPAARDRLRATETA